MSSLDWIQKEIPYLNSLNLIFPLSNQNLKGTKIYQAFHTQKGIFVIVKQIQIIQENKDKIFREVDCMINLQSPHIVKLFHAVQIKNYLFLILEKCEWNCMETFLKGYETTMEKIQNLLNVRGRKFSEYGIFAIFKQIITALQKMHNHEKKFVHRDIKMSNIFIEGQWRIKLGDFGISRSLDNFQINQTKDRGNHNGIDLLHYKGQCPGKQCQKRDTWSLGIVIWQLLTGNSPYSDNLSVSQQRIEHQNIKEIIQSRKHLFQNLWSKWFDLIDRQLIVIDQSKRTSSQQLYQNLKEFQKDFTKHLKKKYGSFYLILQEERQRVIEKIQQLNPNIQKECLKTNCQKLKLELKGIFNMINRFQGYINYNLEDGYRFFYFAQSMASHLIYKTSKRKYIQEKMIECFLIKIQEEEEDLEVGEEIQDLINLQVPQQNTQEKFRIIQRVKTVTSEIIQERKKFRQQLFKKYKSKLESITKTQYIKNINVIAQFKNQIQASNFENIQNLFKQLKKINQNSQDYKSFQLSFRAHWMLFEIFEQKIDISQMTTNKYLHDGLKLYIDLISQSSVDNLMKAVQISYENKRHQSSSFKKYK